MPRPNRRSTLLLSAVAAVGFAGGLGALTFLYGQGTAYLSDDPVACTQCHIMQDQFDSWVKGSHTSVATCNGCHLPDGPILRWVSKADNGFFHSWAFTFRNHPDPIQIKPRNRRIAERSCVGCHQAFVHDMLASSSPGEPPPSCLHCHKDAGHAAFR